MLKILIIKKYNSQVKSITNYCPKLYSCSAEGIVRIEGGREGSFESGCVIKWGRTWTRDLHLLLCGGGGARDKGRPAGGLRDEVEADLDKSSPPPLPLWRRRRAA